MSTPLISSVLVDGMPLPVPPPTVYLALHKPRGVATTLGAVPRASSKGGQRARRRAGVPLLSLGKLLRDDASWRDEAIPHRNPLHGVAPVGRLDADSEGLLLLTNDGTLAQYLLHPGACTKRYVVAIEPRVPLPAAEVTDVWASAAAICKRGVVLGDGVMARADRCRALAPAAVEEELGELCGEGLASTAGGDCSPVMHAELVMRTGARRVVRRMMREVGFRTHRLCRASIGPAHIGLSLASLGLKPLLNGGTIVELPPGMVAELYAGLSASEDVPDSLRHLPTYHDGTDRWVEAHKMASLLLRDKF